MSRPRTGGCGVPKGSAFGTPDGAPTRWTPGARVGVLRSLAGSWGRRGPCQGQTLLTHCTWVVGSGMAGLRRHLGMWAPYGRTSASASNGLVGAAFDHWIPGPATRCCTPTSPWPTRSRPTTGCGGRSIRRRCCGPRWRHRRPTTCWWPTRSPGGRVWVGNVGGGRAATATRVASSPPSGRTWWMSSGRIGADPSRGGSGGGRVHGRPRCRTVAAAVLEEGANNSRIRLRNRMRGVRLLLSRPRRCGGERRGTSQWTNDQRLRW